MWPMGMSDWLKYRLRIHMFHLNTQSNMQTIPFFAETTHFTDRKDVLLEGDDRIELVMEEILSG